MTPQHDLAHLEAELRRLADALASLQRGTSAPDEQAAAALVAATSPSGIGGVVAEALRSLQVRLGEREGVQVLIVGFRHGPEGRATTWYELLSDEAIPKVLGDPRLLRTLELVAHGERLRLLWALASGATGSAEAMDLSGLSQGQFYHHLRALEAAGMVCKVTRDLYEPTVHGTSTLFTILAALSYIGHGEPSGGEEAAG
ncbi:MAG TPA: ArsR family transcriptional regulator [Candidatus Acetothermia bacterium]|nr:ArsR family transcriptional regulator [Candidatus Acetothermia bacterium]